MLNRLYTVHIPDSSQTGEDANDNQCFLTNRPLSYFQNSFMTEKMLGLTGRQLENILC